MYKLTPEQVSKYESKLKFLAPDTGSSGNPKPKFQDLIGKNVGAIVALLDVYSLKMYYNISSQSDIDELVRKCMAGFSMEVKWYYLDHSDIEDSDRAKITLSHL